MPTIRPILIALAFGLAAPPAVACTPALGYRVPSNLELVASAPSDLTRKLYTSAQPFGARVDALADGTIVLSIAGVGDAALQAARAARCALKLVELVPEASVVLTTGRAEHTGSLPGRVLRPF